MQDLLLEDVRLVEEQDDGGALEPRVCDDGLEQSLALLHAVLTKRHDIIIALVWIFCYILNQVLVMFFVGGFSQGLPLSVAVTAVAVPSLHCWTLPKLGRTR